MDGAVFPNREEAGRRLAELYDGPKDDLVVMGIARGGVPIAYAFAHKFHAILEVITARKLPIPWSPEMGFGAIAPDGTVVLNHEVVGSMGITRQEIDRISKDVLEEVHRREKVYRGGVPPMPIEDMNVVLADDGLATGYTMIASIEMVKKQGARDVTVAVPVGPADTVERIRPMVDRVEVLHVAHGYSFAVASFYHDFHDMRDSEITELVGKAHKEHAVR